MQAEKKQWLVLTHQLLKSDFGDSLHTAQERALHAVLDHIQSVTEVMWNIAVTEQMRARLQLLVAPALDILHALHFQQADFFLEMPPVFVNGLPRSFDPETMEDALGQEDEHSPQSYIVASVFPLIYKIVKDRHTGVSRGSLFRKREDEPS